MTMISSRIGTILYIPTSRSAITTTEACTHSYLSFCIRSASRSPTTRCYLSSTSRQVLHRHRAIYLC